MTGLLFPRGPRRMKHPAKDVLREQEVLRLRGEMNRATEQLRAALATN